MDPNDILRLPFGTELRTTGEEDDAMGVVDAICKLCKAPFKWLPGDPMWCAACLVKAAPAGKEQEERSN